MSGINTQSTEIKNIAPHISEFRRFRRVFFSRGLVVFGMVVIVGFVVMALFAPFLAPYDPYIPITDHALSQPNLQHLLGTDVIGRDTLSRIIFGARTSLTIGLIVVGLASVIGMSLGMIAGYIGGWIYTVIMRGIDVLMTIPMILLALIVAALLGEGIRNVIIALTVGMVPIYARLMC